MYLVFDKHWTQPFRSYVIGQWQVFEQSKFRDTVKQWSAIMPDEFLRKISVQVILPKLQQTISRDWCPRDPTMHVKSWLLPWTEVLGKRIMRQVFEDDVRPRIVPLLSDWKPYKPLGMQLVSDWMPLLSEDQATKFSNRYITPKLSHMIQKLEVDPSSQEIEPLNVLFQWSAVLPQPYGAKQLTGILLQHLAPKLLDTL